MAGFPFTLHLGENVALTSAVVPGLSCRGKPVTLHGVAVSLAPERKRSRQPARTLTLNAPHAGETYRCRLKDAAFEQGLIFSGVHIPGDFAATVSITTARHGTIFLRSLGPRLVHVLPETLPTKPSADAAAASAAASCARTRFVESLRRALPGISGAPMILARDIQEVQVNYAAREGVDASLECGRIAVVSSAVLYADAAGKPVSAAMPPAGANWSSPDGGPKAMPAWRGGWISCIRAASSVAVPEGGWSGSGGLRGASGASPEGGRDGPRGEGGHRGGPAVPEGVGASEGRTPSEAKVSVVAAEAKAEPKAAPVPAAPASASLAFGSEAPTSAGPFLTRLGGGGIPPSLVRCPCCRDGNHGFRRHAGAEMTGVGASEEPPEPAPKEAVRGHDEARPPSPAAPRASTLDGQIDAYVNQIAVESRMGATVASINPAASVAKPAFMRLPAATSAVLSETLLCASDSIVPMMQAPDATKLVPDSPAGYSASHMTRSLAALRGQGPPPWPSRTWSTDDDEWECGPASRGRCRPDSDDDDDDDDATDDEDGVLVQEEEGPASPSAVGAAGAQAEAERAAPEPKRAAPEAEAEAECAAPEQKTAVGAAGAKAADEGPGSEAAAPEPHMAATLVAFPNSIRAGETIRLRTPPFFSEVVFSPPLPAGAKAYVVACGPAARMLNADDWSTACGPNWATARVLLGDTQPIDTSALEAGLTLRVDPPDCGYDGTAWAKGFEMLN
jgi:hypothetical protein